MTLGLLHQHNDQRLHAKFGNSSTYRSRDIFLLITCEMFVEKVCLHIAWVMLNTILQGLDKLPVHHFKIIFFQLFLLLAQILLQIIINMSWRCLKSWKRAAPPSVQKTYQKCIYKITFKNVQIHTFLGLCWQFLTWLDHTSNI